MNKSLKLNIKQAFDLAFHHQNKKNFELAKDLYEKIIKINPDNKNVQFNLGITYEELNQVNKAIECYQKVIHLDPLFISSYNNLALIFHKLGEIKKALYFFKKIIKINPKYIKAYNNLGLIYADLGQYENAIENYLIVLNQDQDNIFAKSNLITALTHFSSNKNHPIIDANNQLNEINKNIEINSLLQNNNLCLFFNKVNKIKNKIKNIKFINFSETQIFRRNSTNPNCDRHHDVFNKLNLIPKFCFSCFKIQIEPVNVLGLIKLFLIFDDIKLSNNNWRKCMIELRTNISGIYKGLIFCSSLEEAETILDKITPVLTQHLKYKSSIKRGCSEFYEPFPNFKIVEQKSKNFMEYPKYWEKIELKENRKLNNQKLVSSLSGLSVSDVLIINQWLNYANLIDDQSFNQIGIEFSHSPYIHKKMSHQTEFRKKEFLC